jgi:putative nucleotidyltransferase with HDIG domain
MRTITRQVRLFVPVTVGAAVLAALVFAEEARGDDWPRLALYVLLVVITYSVSIPDPRGWSVTPSSVLSYLAIYVFGPGMAIIVFFLGRTIGYIIARGWIPWRALFNGAQIALSVGAGAWVFRLAGGSLDPIEWPQMALAVVSGPLISHAANNFFVAVGVSRWRGTPFLGTWVDCLRDLSWQNLLSIPTALVLALLYIRIHHAVILGYLVLLPLQWRAIDLYIKQRRLYAQIVDGLVIAADVNFPLASGHARRVADLAVAIAREMRLSEAAVESVQFAALLHDIGLIGKDDLLERPVHTNEDVEELEEHVNVGAEIARELPRKEIAFLIRHHHERYDGTGYPDGLKGEVIPLGARIIGLAEVADSMASGVYPYRSVSATASIVAHIAAERGRGFDPDVVDAFVRVVEREAVAPAAAHALARPELPAHAARPQGFQA